MAITRDTKNIIKAYATKSPCYKQAKSMTPKGIVLHSTGANNPSLKRYIDAPNEVGQNVYGNHWNTLVATKSVHAFIGLDKNGVVRIAQMLPYNYACWGCGSGKNGSYNYNPTGHIQFEICEDGLNNREYFEQTYRAAIEYCVMLCKQFGFDPMKDIVSHNEANKLGYASNHGDPNHWWSKYDANMDMFRSAVKKAMGATTASSAPTQTLKDFDPTVTYAVYAGGKWWSDIKNLTDYAGVENKPVRGVIMKVSAGTIKYRVHTKKGWYSWISKYDKNDYNNGFAGDLKNDIDMIQVVYTSPSGYKEKKAKYRVSTVKTTAYYSWQTDIDTTSGMDGYAGAANKAIDKLQIDIV